MRFAMAVVKRSLCERSDAPTALAYALQKGGYPISELLFFSTEKGQGLEKSIDHLLENYDGVFVAADAFVLPTVQEIFSALSLAEEEAGIYARRGTPCVLLTLDEQGMEFAQNAAVAYLNRKFFRSYGYVVARAVGASEEGVTALLARMEKIGGGQFALYRRREYDEDVVTLVYNDGTPKMLLDSATRSLVEGLGDTMYALNDVSLEEQLVTLLKVRGKKISVAESFTGGGIAKRITSVSGASAVYFEGVNTYDEKSKIKRLGVSEKGLQTMGAVSDQTAYEMALGLLRTGDCDLAVATTGLAGPKSDKSMLPVGLSYIAVGTKEKIFVYRYKLSGTRKEITEKAINYALFLAYKRLKNL